MSNPVKDRFADVKPPDALGSLRRRSQASRAVVVIVAVVVVLAGALLVGLLWRSASSGIKNAPAIPQVAV